MALAVLVRRMAVWEATPTSVGFASLSAEAAAQLLRLAQMLAVGQAVVQQALAVLQVPPAALLVADLPA